MRNILDRQTCRGPERDIEPLRSVATNAGWVVGLLCAWVLSSCTRVAIESGRVSLDAACTANSTGQTSIKVTLLNGTADHLSIVAGVVLGNGDRLAEAVSLRLKAPGAAEVETYGYSDPRHPGVAGRMDPWRLEVPAGGSTSFDVDARHFPSPTSGRRFSTEVRGDVRVRFRGLGSNSWADRRPWTGTVESEPMRVPESCHVG